MEATPNKRQQEAIEYLDGPLLVLAGPGTGKTELLSQKVAHILTETDASPEEILCLTYTESATTNMSSRLLSKIGPVANRILISTYHGFGVYVLNAYKNYATEIQRDLTEPISDVARYKLIHEIQKSLPAYDILRGDDIGNLISAIDKAKAARLTPEDLIKISETNAADFIEINAAISNTLLFTDKGNSQEKLHNGYEPLIEIFQKIIHEDHIAIGVKHLANLMYEDLVITMRDALAVEKFLITPLSDWKKRWFEKDADKNYVAKGRVANLKLRSLANIFTEYQTRLQASGLYDYTDMIQEAIKLLKTDDGFRNTMTEHFQYILLDEFQDTNLAQAEIIRLLTDYEKPVIMAVGDDDQAICSFQGADVNSLINFRNHYDAKVISLTDNYRCSADILKLSRDVADQLDFSFVKEFSDSSEVIEKNLTANRKFEDQEISRHEFLEASAEYHWITEKISELTKSGVKQSDIAIITPKHKYIPPLLPYLRSHKEINIAYEKRENIFEDLRIHEILVLAKFIYELSEERQPSHRIMEILSFPFFEIDPITVLRTVNAAREDRKSTLDYFLKSEDEELKNLAKFFAALVAKSFNTPLELFIDYLTGASAINDDLRSPFLAYYSAAGSDNFSTFEFYENLAVLREAIRNYSRNKNTTLKDLITMLSDYELSEMPLTNTSPYRDSADAVQILTVHSSKGLEFAYVFMLDVCKNGWEKGRNNTTFSLPKNLLHINNSNNTDDERLRLLFVAITRAKHHLYMTSSKKDFTGTDCKYLSYLNESDQKDINGNDYGLSPFLPEKTQHIKKHYTGLSEDQTLSDLRAHWVGAYAKLNHKLDEILLEKQANYKLTATGVTSFIDIRYIGPQMFYANNIMGAPSESYVESLTLGNVIHAVFEQVTNRKLSDTDAIKFFHEKLSTTMIPPEDIEYITERGEGAIKASLKEFGDILRHKDSKAELNLQPEHLKFDGVPITGKIDHINIDKENKTIEIYDFKSSPHDDKLLSTNWESNAKLFIYALQLEFYKLLLNLSPTYRNYKIERAHILFVVPDNTDGKVRKKTYEYTEESGKRIKDLVRAIYKHVTTLDFKYDKELFIPPDSSYSIKDIKAFIDKVIGL